MSFSNVIGLKGYDPVSYFDGSPVQGTPGYTADHGGVRYVFSTQENLARFKENPHSFTPKYGGFCATAMSEGKFFDVDPLNYKVSGGNLFVFYKGPDGDTLPGWNENESERIESAEGHWAAFNNL
jgi:YHS domain-containing protein